MTAATHHSPPPQEAHRRYAIELSRRRRRNRWTLALLASLLVVVMGWASTSGPYRVELPTLLRTLPALLGFEVSVPVTAENVLLAIRWPRVALAAVVGAALAVVGVAVQGVFRNPLAAPEVIGTSSGAALGAALAIVGLSGSYEVIPESIRLLVLPGAAFVGALGATLLVYQTARSREGHVDVVMMLLAGIGVNAMCFSLVGFATAVSDDSELRSLSLWMLGALSGATWQRTLMVGAGLLAFGVALYRRRHALDAFLLGEDVAFDSGEDPRALKRLVVFGGSGLLALAISFTGLISFVGLVVPHAMRGALGARHAALIPGSAIAGALLLVVADTLGRTVIAPAELPPGVVTGLVGAPVFILLLSRVRAARQGA